ncbi:hypothetical protein J6590_004300 [Homalodisca vitripennis]|nr:hypothetical protein J6590_004300 [Homalodisca vitripennis]
MPKTPIRRGVARRGGKTPVAISYLARVGRQRSLAIAHHRTLVGFIRCEDITHYKYNWERAELTSCSGFGLGEACHLPRSFFGEQDRVRRTGSASHTGQVNWLAARGALLAPYLSSLDSDISLSSASVYCA